MKILPPTRGNRSCQLSSASRSANHELIGWHWLASNSYFLRIFIFYFSKPLGINIECLHSILLGFSLFIQIYLDSV